MKHIEEKIVESGEWLVEEDISLDSLVIKEGATLTAPKGKELVFTWFGTGREILPGEYRGDIVISVKDSFKLQPGSLCASGLPTNYHTAILINDNEVMEDSSALSTVKGGTVTGTEINDVTIRSTAKGFNGITVRGNSECTINRPRIYLDGDFGNDWIGYGTGIHCGGESKVTINDADIRMLGVIRNTIHAGDHSNVVVNNSRLFSFSPEYDGMNPTWQLGIRGNSRATMVADFANIEYNNCYICGNGWGLISIDGGVKNSIYLKDCKLEMLGARARGYCSFSIGDAIITYDHTDVDVQGFGMLVGGNGLFPGRMPARGVFTNGSKVHSDQYGVKVFYTRVSSIKMDKKCVIDADDAAIVVMGSQSIMDLDDVELHSGTGVLIKMIDSTYTGLGPHPYIPHIGKEDTYIPGRDLTKADPEQDVIVNLSNMEATGDMLNSTTNLDVTDPPDEGSVEIYEYDEMDGGMHPVEYNMETSFPVDGMHWLRVPPEFDVANPALSGETELIGPHNLAVNFKNAKLTGVISSATAAYREGLTLIDVRNDEELCDVTQTPAEAVNNGVIVTIDAASVWTLTGDAYLTSLTLEEGAVLSGADGKTVKMTVDGAETPVQAGIYTGKIKLELC